MLVAASRTPQRVLYEYVRFTALWSSGYLLFGSNFDGHARGNRTASQYFAKDAVCGHDTIASDFVNSASRVAFLADLRDLQQHISNANLAADRQYVKINAPGEKVLCKVPRANLCAEMAHLFGAFIGEQAYLSMPVSTVGISFDAEPFNDINGLDRLFLHALCFADADVEYTSRHMSSHLGAAVSRIAFRSTYNSDSGKTPSGSWPLLSIGRSLLFFDPHLDAFLALHEI